MKPTATSRKPRVKFINLALVHSIPKIVSND